jgi:hypothetical protein
MTEDTIRAMFREWWVESYGRPPGVHAEMTHVAFAQHLLSLNELIQPVAESDEST